MKFRILLILLAFLATGCSLIHENDGPCPGGEDDDSEYITLSFRLVAQLPESSRAGESEWPEFEDCVFADEFSFYIYAVLSDGSQPLLMKVDNLAGVTDPFTNISGGPSIFTLRASIAKTDFEDIIPSDEDIIRLRIVVFANSRTAVSSLNSFEKYNSFSSLIASATAWNYNIFGTIYPGTGSMNGGLKKGAKIPMYGTALLSVSRENLNKSTPSSPVWGDDMYLLRSLAKIKVVDHIENRNESTGLPRVESVTFNAPTSHAFTLPYDAINYVNGQQVSSPRICDGMPMQIALLKRKPGEWIGYIPEQSIDKPKITINITYELKPDGTPLDQVSFEVPMTGYNGQTFEFGDNILRNHIYTLSVDGALHEILFSLDVEKWEKGGTTEIEMKNQTQQ